MTVSVQEAEADLDALLSRASRGEEVIIARDGQPIAKLSGIPTVAHQRVPGTAKGKIIVPPDFDAPLPDDVLDLFEQ